MAKTVDQPMYDLMEDTPWITRNRELNAYSYGLLNDAIANLYNYDKNAMQSVADAYTAAQWNDLNRGYNQAVNQNLARQYNRLGTLGSTSGLYTTEGLQQQYNDLASRVAAQTASQYNNLVNQELNRRLTGLNAYNTLFNNSGQITQQNDLMNYQTAQTNKDRQWQNDVQRKNWLSNAIGNTIGGAIEGFAASKNPWGALAGGVIGGVQGFSGTGQNANNIGQTVNALNNTFAQRTTPTPTNVNTFSGVTGNYGNWGLNTNQLSDTMSNNSFKNLWGKDLW